MLIATVESIIKFVTISVMVYIYRNVIFKNVLCCPITTAYEKVWRRYSKECIHVK